MKLALIFAALLMVAWIDAPMPQAQATPKDYREVLKMLRGIEDSLEELSRSKDGEKDDCRGLSPEKTVRCAAEAFDTSADQALSRVAVRDRAGASSRWRWGTRTTVRSSTCTRPTRASRTRCPTSSSGTSCRRRSTI